MNSQNQNISVVSKPSTALALHENAKAKHQLDSLLLGCFTVQKLYGREPEAFESINRMFHSLLGKYPADTVLAAIKLWLERSQEFPTVADIISLIKRKGKPPLKESDIIAIRKKDGEDRTSAEWSMLAEWDAEQQEGWSDIPDPVADKATLEENIRLRREVADLKREVIRLGDMLHQANTAKGIEPPKPTVEDKVLRTIRAMQSGGAPEDDVATFAAQYGMAGRY